MSDDFSLPQFTSDSQTSFNRFMIELTQGYQTIVDNEDADLAKYKWRVDNNRLNHYAVRSVQCNGKWAVVLLHRVILSRVLGREIERHEMVDHRDGNGLNNARSNIRLCTNQQNQANSRCPSHNTTGLKGVGRYRERYRAYIKVNGRTIHLGYHDTPESAHEAYYNAAQHYFGEFASKREALS